MPKLTGQQLVQLKNSVVNCFDESDWKELGALTNMLDDVENHSRLLRSLSWNDSDYDGYVLTFLRKMTDSSDKNLKIVKDYIANRCTESGEDISSDQSGGRKIVFSPNIFDVPTESVDFNLISVMMPFQPDLSAVDETIKDAAKEAGLSCKRANDIWNHSTVIQDIFTLIFQSYIVVCDFTNKNPNVFYEAGIAHTLGKHMVPITQSKQDIPFDLQHHRYVNYLNNGEGLETLRNVLASRFSTLVENRNVTWP